MEVYAALAALAEAEERSMGHMADLLIREALRARGELPSIRHEPPPPPRPGPPS